jgi:hypothetical protein
MARHRARPALPLRRQRPRRHGTSECALLFSFVVSRRRGGRARVGEGLVARAAQGSDPPAGGPAQVVVGAWRIVVGAGPWWSGGCGHGRAPFGIRRDRWWWPPGPGLAWWPAYWAGPWPRGGDWGMRLTVARRRSSPGRAGRGGWHVRNDDLPGGAPSLGKTPSLAAAGVCWPGGLPGRTAPSETRGCSRFSARPARRAPAFPRRHRRRRGGESRRREPGPLGGCRRPGLCEIAVVTFGWTFPARPHATSPPR